MLRASTILFLLHSTLAARGWLLVAGSCGRMLLQVVAVALGDGVFCVLHRVLLVSQPQIAENASNPRDFGQPANNDSPACDLVSFWALALGDVLLHG